MTHVSKAIIPISELITIYTNKATSAKSTTEFRVLTEVIKDLYNLKSKLIEKT